MIILARQFGHFLPKDKSIAYIFSVIQSIADGMFVMNMRLYFSFRKVYTIAVSVFVVLILTIATSNAISAKEVDLAQQSVISLDAAVNMVRSQYSDGKILKTKEEKAGNGKVYVIKMITADSRVLHIRVDAQSGKIVE